MLALVAGPPSPANLKLPFPATVVMTPRSTLRIRWEKVSAITRLAFGSSQTALGNCMLASRADPPSPEKPNVPLPAIVEIVPEVLTRRIRLLLKSAMRICPDPSTKIPETSDKQALTAGPPSPQKARCPLPTLVLMTPDELTRRIR